MAITYEDSLTTSLSKVRFYIGDTVEGNGPRPSNGNYSDNEINAILALSGDSVEVATASLFDTLAAEWSKYAVSFQMGPRKEELFRIATRFESKSNEWAQKAGTASKAFAGGLVRRSDANS